MSPNLFPYYDLNTNCEFRVAILTAVQTYAAIKLNSITICLHLCIQMSDKCVSMLDRRALFSKPLQ